jgi:hypothetical protein
LSVSEVNYFLRGLSNPKILILDACREASLGENTLAISTGLNSQIAPPNTLISYATSPGKVAFDGPHNGNSPFATSLNQSIKNNSTITAILRETRISTINLTNGKQIPWESSSLLLDANIKTSNLNTDKQDPQIVVSNYVSKKSTKEDINDLKKTEGKVSSYTDSINYLIKVAKIADNNSFFSGYPNYNISSTPDIDRKDTISTLKFNLDMNIDRYSLYNVASSLQNGYINLSCREGSKLDHECISERRFYFEPNLKIAMKLAIFANENNINSSLLARHYEKGWLVEKDLIKAYDLYMKDKNFGSEYYWTDINTMIQNELSVLGNNIKIDGDFGKNSCDVLKKYVDFENCTNPPSKTTIKKFVSFFNKLK